jgi:hypothetical protein
MNDVKSRGPGMWFVPGPGPDESLRSVLSRAASLYRTTPQNLWSFLCDPADGSASDVDDPNPSVILRWARCLGVEPSALRAHCRQDHPRWLAPEARQSHCPHCWAEDDEAGRPRGFRRGWDRVLAMWCPVHQVPLRSSLSGQRLSLDREVLREGAQDLLRRVDNFGEQLERSIFDAEPWPTAWRGSPQQARALVLVCALNLHSTDEFPALSSLLLPSQMPNLLHGPLHRMQPLRSAPWEALRHLADPAVRRAALWVAACLSGALETPAHERTRTWVALRDCVGRDTRHSRINTALVAQVGLPLASV